MDGLLNEAPAEPAPLPQTASAPPSFPEFTREPSAEKMEPSAEKTEPSAEKMEPSAEKMEPSDIPAYQQLAYMPDEAVQLIDLPADFYAVQIL
ncbi:MAG: hypothetical protein O7H39_00615, partial [Gammaproteobacteria bacterium]|nr:hypothetical protein [Gammaproteobacteria bacterium]